MTQWVDHPVGFVSGKETGVGFFSCEMGGFCSPVWLCSFNPEQLWVRVLHFQWDVCVDCCVVYFIQPRALILVIAFTKCCFFPYGGRCLYSCAIPLIGPTIVIAFATGCFSLQCVCSCVGSSSRRLVLSVDSCWCFGRLLNDFYKNQIGKTLGFCFRTMGGVFTRVWFILLDQEQLWSLLLNGGFPYIVRCVYSCVGFTFKSCRPVVSFGVGFSLQREVFGRLCDLCLLFLIPKTCDRCCFLFRETCGRLCASVGLEVRVCCLSQFY